MTFDLKMLQCSNYRLNEPVVPNKSLTEPQLVLQLYTPEHHPVGATQG
jgi:hypothetical protein